MERMSFEKAVEYATKISENFYINDAPIGLVAIYRDNEQSDYTCKQLKNMDADHLLSLVPTELQVIWQIHQQEQTLHQLLEEFEKQWHYVPIRYKNGEQVKAQAWAANYDDAAEWVKNNIGEGWKVVEATETKEV